MNKWELINNDGDSVTLRLKVFQGWIVQYECRMPGQSYVSSGVFVPDRNHEWKLEDAAL